MLGRVEWKGDSKVNCFNEAGDCIEIDWDDGPTPVQITLQMIGACSLADIQTGLKARKIDSQNPEEAASGYKNSDNTTFFGYEEIN